MWPAHTALSAALVSHMPFTQAWHWGQPPIQPQLFPVVQTPEQQTPSAPPFAHAVRFGWVAQVPRLPARLHAWHAAQLAVEQQTLFTQLPELHCAPRPHVVPPARTVTRGVSSERRASQRTAARS